MKKFRKRIILATCTSTLLLSVFITPTYFKIVSAQTTVGTSNLNTNVSVSNEELINTTSLPGNETPVSSLDNNDPTFRLSKVTRPYLLNQYKEKPYDVFKKLYNDSSTGIYTMDLKADGTPVIYDAVTLESAKEKGTKVYAWNGSKWAVQTTYPDKEYGLRVINWTNGKWEEKVLRYTKVSGKTNPFTSTSPLEIQRDIVGEWYMSVKKDDNYYIYQLDKSLKVKYVSNVSSLTSSKYSDFYLLMNGKVLLKTYEIQDESSPTAEWNEKYWVYQPLQLLNLKQDKITRLYETGFELDGYNKVSGKFVYMRDKSKENIIVLNSYTGKVKNIIPLGDYEELVKVHDYSEELSSKYYYDYEISGKYIYILKKTGVYRIDLGNGKFRQIMDGSYYPFGIQDMRFLDFDVKDENNLYILSVFFDERFPTNFYTYTK
jgi:hypothetical protein